MAGKKIIQISYWCCWNFCMSILVDFGRDSSFSLDFNPLSVFLKKLWSSKKWSDMRIKDPSFVNPEVWNPVAISIKWFTHFLPEPLNGTYRYVNWSPWLVNRQTSCGVNQSSLLKRLLLQNCVKIYRTTFFSLKLFLVISAGPLKYKHKIDHKNFTF